jgi:hypothetical protein
MSRIETWKAGKLHTLVPPNVVEPCPKRAKREKATTLDLIWPAVERALADGALSKAAQLVLDSSKGPCSREDVEKIQRCMADLHPQESTDNFPPAPPPVDADDVHVSPESVLQAVKSFPLGSSAGPSGLRPAHLSECLDSQGGGPLAGTLAKLAEKVLCGLFPQDLMVELGCARLIALPKPNGSYRPIAVGETLRRLVGKVFLDKFGKTVGLGLQPIQVGVGVRGGLDSVVLEVEDWLRFPQPGTSVLQLDFKNAFNSLSREWILRQVASLPAPLQHYAHYFCGQATTLLGRGYTVRSESGVQQGDPCGPLLFSLAIQPLLLQLKSLGLDVRFYLDDGILRGSPVALEKALEEINRFGSASGLTLNWDKSVHYDPPSGLESYPLLARVPIVPKSRGLTVLGVPLGSTAFIKSRLNKFSADYVAALSRLVEIGDAQVAYHLLRVCLGACRAQFLLRLLPFPHGKALASELSQGIRGCLGNILGQHLDDDHWNLATFSLKSGGLGIADPVHVHAPGFVAARLAALFRFPSVTPASVQIAIKDALAQLCLAPRAVSWASKGCHFDDADFQPDWLQQNWWSLQVDERRTAEWDPHVDWRLRACRLLFSGPHASDWLRIIPVSEASTNIDSTGWQRLLTFRLGLPFPNALPACPCCHETQDPYGDHALACRKSGWYFRHNLIRDLLREQLTSCGYKVRPGEPKVPCAESDRLDLLIVFADQGADRALDVTVSHPLQPSLANAEVDPTRHLAKRATLKQMRYGGSCAASGWSLGAIVALTSGQWSSATGTLLSALARRLSMSSGKDAGLCAEQLWAGLSITLMRGCSHQLLRCFPPTAPTTSAVREAGRDGRPVLPDCELLLTPLP